MKKERIISESAPDVEVIFEFNGARKNPVISGYRPMHLVKEDYLTTGLHRYYGAETVAADGTAEGTITFITPEAYPHCMYIGKQINIQEGKRVVGTATVTKVLNPLLAYAELKYPVLLVHGMGFRDHKRICYWGRIPKALEQMGAKIVYGGQDSNASIETNARHIAARIDDILLETDAKKVNIIAHSKGGLDCRYAISCLGMAEKVASLTTISTPHHGSKTVDALLKIPAFLVKAGCFCADIWFSLLGDKNPDTYSAISSFTTAAAKKFNEEVTDSESIYYRSYAFVMQKASSDIFMWLTNLVVGAFEGENDGLLAPRSVKWGDFRGTFRGEGRRGISHCDEVDMRRRPLSKKRGEGVSDIVDIYREIISDLYEMGL